MTDERFGAPNRTRSEGDLVIESDSEANGSGSIILRTAGVDRAQIASDGTPSGLFSSLNADGSLLSSAVQTALGGSQTVSDPLARWHETLATDAANAVIEIWGDSTAEETNYPDTYIRLRTYHVLDGMPLMGMVGDASHIVEHGNSGVALNSYLAGSVGTAGSQLADFEASTADLIVLRWLTNDTRLGARTQAQMEADLRTLIGLAPAQADIVVTVPPTFTTTVVGTDYLGGATAAQAQARWEAGRAACLAIQGDYPHVLVVDPSRDVLGDQVAASSPLMNDQLHPNMAGQRKWADWLAGLIGFKPATRVQSVGPSAYRWQVLGIVTARGNGFIDIDTLDDRLARGKEWPLTTSDYLWIPGFAPLPLQLTSATFPASANSVRILKAGTDFSAVPVNTVVMLTGDHPAEGAQGGRIALTIDPGSIAAGSTLAVTATLTGAATWMGIVVQPPTGLDARLTWSARVSAADTIEIRIHNPTAGAIDPASGTWYAWLLR